MSRTTLIENGREKAQKARETARPRVALIGAGNFAMRTLLPAMTALKSPPAIAAVGSNQGPPALLVARAAGAERATTDTAAVLADASIEAVFITTRHNAHASLATAALRAGKHVWVEKPLCLNLIELAEIEAVFGSTLSDRAARKESGLGPVTKHDEQRTRSAAPTLMVGFNRRFSPMAVALRNALAAKSGPSRITITVNAGRLDPDHWTLDARIGGGRIVGEACHFVDFVRFLTGTAIQNVVCVRRDTDGQDGGAFEMTLGGGHSALIDYRTDLPAHIPKEVISVTGDGYVAQLHNWARLTSSGLGGLSQGGYWSRAPRKGHPEALAAFLEAVRGGAGPIAPDEIFEVSRWSIAMQAMRTHT